MFMPCLFQDHDGFYGAGDQIPGHPLTPGDPRGVHLVSSSFHVRLVLCAEKPFAGGLIGGESVPWPLGILGIQMIHGVRGNR